MELGRLRHATLVCLLAFGPLLLWIILCYVLFFRHPTPPEPIEIQTIAYEASNQSLLGQIYVASVIKTRMAQRDQTAQEVVLAPYQFSCWHPKTQEPTQRRLLSREDLEIAGKAWEMAHPGTFNHYSRHDVAPYWISAAKSATRVGDHIFYEL